MAKYGDTAVKTAEILAANNGEHPRDIWNLVASEIFGAGTYGQKKDCPRNAFLGLCQEGMIKGVNRGKYTSAMLNSKYAVKAVEILREKPELVDDYKVLWLESVGEQKAYNQQMDVVISLWKNGYINHE